MGHNWPFLVKLNKLIVKFLFIETSGSSFDNGIIQGLTDAFILA